MPLIGNLPSASMSAGSNQSTSANTSMSNSRTFGTEATSAARASAAAANEAAMERWKTAANFNAAEAQKQRDWQEKMANTVYQRTMADMRAAGINPVLAAGGGLGTASVSGGSAASVAAPETYMANTYADTMSSAQSQGNSQSSGSNYSEAGFATFLKSMSALAEGLMNAQTSSTTINFAVNALEDTAKDFAEKVEDEMYTEEQKKDGTVKKTGNYLIDGLNNFFQALPNGIGEQQYLPYQYNDYNKKDKKN